MRYKIEVDTHTHTILSGHAFSTLRENVTMAEKRGLSGICLTDHGPSTPGSMPAVMWMAGTALPDHMGGIRVFRGIEASIMDTKGALDLCEDMLRPMEWIIASIHTMSQRFDDPAEATKAYLAALENPMVDVLGHIYQPAVKCDYEAVIKKAIHENKLIEFNNSYISPKREKCRENFIECAKLAKKYSARVVISTDSHVDEMIGDITYVNEVFEQLDFPEKLIVNRSMETFETYMLERKKRI